MLHATLKGHQMTPPLRFGLVGTGHWARITHAPALASTHGIELAAVWGRNAEAAADLAASYHATAHHDLAAFLADVDAVAFAVPPDIRAPIAIRAARSGKHLMLEKPVAITASDADALADAVEQSRVASVVFFTARFQADVRVWLDRVSATGGWAGGCAVWLGSALQPRSPFNTPWRQDKGGLWDLAPHVISLLWASLGPVRSVTAQAGLADVTHPDPAPPERGDEHGHRDAERARGRSVRRALPVGAGRPLGRADGDRAAGDRAADRPHRAGGQRPVAADRSPLRRPVRPRGWTRPGRRPASD